MDHQTQITSYQISIQNAIVLSLNSCLASEFGSLVSFRIASVFYMFKITCVNQFYWGYQSHTNTLMDASFLRGLKPYKLMFCTYNYTWQLKSQDLEFSIGYKFYRASMQLTEFRSTTVKMAVLFNAPLKKKSFNNSQQIYKVKYRAFMHLCFYNFLNQIEDNPVYSLCLRTFWKAKLRMVNRCLNFDIWYVRP